MGWVGGWKFIWVEVEINIVLGLFSKIIWVVEGIFGSVDGIISNNVEGLFGVVDGIYGIVEGLSSIVDGISGTVEGIITIVDGIYGIVEGIIEIVEGILGIVVGIYTSKSVHSLLVSLK